MRFKKGDLLTSIYQPTSEPIARVDRVTREGVVHCINLVACSTMDEGSEFRFSQKTNAIYILHKKTGNVQKRIQGGVSKFKKGDLLTSKWNRTDEPLARVEKVAAKGIVHCVNLRANAMMKVDAEFQFSQGTNTYYTLHSRG
jgi:hypothetical protein